MEFLVIAILLMVTGAQQTQMEGPQNTLSVAGSNVTLKCSPPSGNCTGVDWLKSTSSNTPQTVFSDRDGILSAFRDRYSVDSSSGCDLVINDVKLTDAGRFTCTIFISGNTVVKNAYLIILSTRPKCATNASLDGTVEGDGVQMTCEVTYNGTGKALMFWKGMDNAPNAVENGKTIRRSYSVAVSAPEFPSATCVTSFEVYHKAYWDLAQNVPTASCETPAIKVLHSVRDVTLEPSHFYYPPGTNITCMAKGHPTPTFKWQVEDNGIWRDIHDQTRSSFTTNTNTSRRYRCVAMNVVRGNSYNATSDEFQVNNIGVQSSEVHVGSAIGIGFGIGLLAAILLAFIASATLVRLGYVEFRLRPVNKSPGDVPQPMKQKKSHSSHQQSSIPSREAASSDGQQESAYASLGNDRYTSEYASLAQRPQVKPKKKSRP